MVLESLTFALKPSGLMIRGGFYPSPEDGIPEDYASVVMIGNAGPDMWRAFQGYDESAAHPLDEWTKRVIDRIAKKFSAKPVYPFTGPPYYPFQKWAMRADDVFPSPVGPLIHPLYGLWHAYRGALLFKETLDLPDPPNSPRPCDTCVEKPCLSTCPVGAFSDKGYDVPACRAHIGSDEGQDCLNKGCLARRACPIGQDYIY